MLRIVCFLPFLEIAAAACTALALTKGKTKASTKVLTTPSSSSSTWSTTTTETIVIDYEPAWSYNGTVARSTSPILRKLTILNALVKTDPALDLFADDESKWPGRRCQKGGKRQSPIDIRTKDVIKDFARQYIKYGPLQFKGYHKVLVTGINNGHTIQFSTEGDEGIHPVLSGGPLKHNYRLEQLHFHWLSEHAINGVKFPMELHFVHVRSDLKVIEALSRRDGLAIVSVFGNVQAEIEDDQVEASEFMQYIPKLLNTGDRVSGVILDMTKLIRANTDMYYTYSGSLSSPECNEAVVWIIFKTPIHLTDAQYRLFGKVGVGRYNFRSLQKLRNHRVFTPGVPKVHVPQIAIYFSDIIKAFAEFFRNLGSYVSHSVSS